MAATLSFSFNNPLNKPFRKIEPDTELLRTGETRAGLLSRQSHTTTSTPFQDRVFGGVVGYTVKILYSTDLTIQNIEPFTMSLVMYLYPVDKTKSNIVIDYGQITKNETFNTYTINVPNLERTNYYYRIVGINYWNVTQEYTGFLELIGPPGGIGDIGPMGSVGPNGYIGSTGPVGGMGDMGSLGPLGATGSIGAKGSDGVTGPDGSHQLWVLDSDKNITTMGNIGIGVTGPTESLVVGGTMNIRKNVSALNGVAENVLNTDVLSIGKPSTGSLDISGNTFVSGNWAIHGNTSAYSMDVSGSVHVQTELLLSKLYKNYRTPTSRGIATIEVNYQKGDEYLLNTGNLNQNYECILQNLPQTLFTPFVITIMHEYTEIQKKFYCQTVKINGKSYTPQFNGGNPVVAKMTNIVVQKLTFIYYSATNLKIFCDLFNYV